ncbi:MAG: Ig-like domain-containing protein [bacterium]
MRYTIFKITSAVVVAIALFSVTSCGKKTSPPSVAAPGQTGVIATLPWEGARLMPLNAPIVINFSNPLNQDKNGAEVSLVSSSGQAIPGQVSIQSNYLFFTPSTSLMPLTYYRFTLSGTIYDENNKQVFLPAQGLTFSFETEGQYVPLVNVPPALINIFPAPNGPIFTNAVFRLTFSQPLSQASIAYGQSIKLFDATSNTLVPVKLLPIGNNVVIQPVSDLTAGQNYTLTITNKLTGINGLSVTAPGMDNNGVLSYTFKPLPTGKQTDLTIYLDPSVQLDNSGNIINMNNVNATGIPVNANIVSSKIVGTSIAYLTGYLLTIMGDASVNPALNPIAIPAGQRLYGSSLAINLGGVIPTGLISKKLAITFLDNASVFMAGNAYQGINPQAPPAMYAIEDINMTAQDPITNAVLNQNLMGVQLTGTVTVDKTDGSLIINFMGVTELSVMGIEKAPVLLFLRFRSVPVGWVAPQRDNTFVATGTIPYNGDDRIGTDSGFIINFSGPVDPANFRNLISFGPTGSTIGYQTIYNGSSVIVQPYNLLNPLWPVPLSPLTTYGITASAGLASIMGTSLNQNAVFSFTTDAQEYMGATPTKGTYFTPVIATVFPEDGGVLPLFTHPYISLDKFIDPTSVAYNQNVFVTDTTAGIRVTGGVVVTGKKIQFIPSQPLISGDQYTFAVSHTIKDIDGYTLTQDAAIHFTAESTPWFPILSQELSPVADRNQDAYVDGFENPTPENAIVMGQTQTSGTLLGLLPFTAVIQPQSPSYLSGQLNALVTGITVDSTGNPQMQFVVDDGAKQFGTNITIIGTVYVTVTGLGQIQIGQTNVTGRLMLSLLPFTTTQVWSCPTMSDLGGGVKLVRPACGYIAYDTSAQQLTAVTYMAATATASDPTVQQMMSPYQPTEVVLQGPVTFLPDGRLALTMSGTTTMTSDLLAAVLGNLKIGTAYFPTTIYIRIVSTIPSIWN